MVSGCTCNKRWSYLKDFLLQKLPCPVRNRVAPEEEDTDFLVMAEGVTVKRKKSEVFMFGTRSS